MVTVSNACKEHIPFAHSGDKKPSQSVKIRRLLSTIDFSCGRQFGEEFFLTERRGNVIENKGLLWKTYQ
jgi:hypothetical protein